MSAPARPYRSTPIFDETTLPNALRARHATKAGVWGVVRVIEGRLGLTYLHPEVDVDLEEGEILLCESCGVELEVISGDPLELALAPEEEEDWGE